MGSLRKWLGWQNSGVEASAWAGRPTLSTDAQDCTSADGPAPNVRPLPVSLASKTAMRIVHRRVEFSTLKLEEAVRRFNTPDPFRVDHQLRRLAS